MPVLGVDVGSTRVHVAIAHEGRAAPVVALDGLPYIPSVVGYSHGHALVGTPARAHFLVSPAEVLFGPARYLGGGRVKLGDEEHEPQALVAWLLKQAGAAGLVAARGTIDGVALSRPAWASPEALQALAAAADQAGMSLLRTEVPTTLAALALLVERGPMGLVMLVDVGGWKVEATVAALEPGVVQALGRSVDATIGGSWIDGRLVKALVHQVAAENERKLLADKLCYALLREQTESMRIQLSTQNSVRVNLPFLIPALGAEEPPPWDPLEDICANLDGRSIPAGVVARRRNTSSIPPPRASPAGRLDRPNSHIYLLAGPWRLERPFLEVLAQPLFDAIQVVCGEALERAKLKSEQIQEAFVLGGLARMPAVRDAVGSFFGRPATGKGDVDGLAARGAALVGAASLGYATWKVLDDLDEGGRAVPAAGWGQPIPPSLTPRPEPLGAPFAPAFTLETAPAPHPSARDQVAAEKPAPAPSPSAPHGLPPAGTTAHPPASPAHPARPSEPTLPSATVESIQPPTPPPDKTRDRSLPSQGEIRNPRDPAGLAAVPLGGPLDITPPLSVSVLLLAISRRRSFSGRLKLKRENREADVAIVRGGAAGSSLDMEQLRRSFEWPDGTYQITDEAPSARLVSMRQPMVRVVVHGIRSCLRAMDLGEVLNILARHLREAPQLTESSGALVPILGLSPRELRFAEHALDGATSLDEILRRGGIGRETAAHLLFVLHLLGALEWCSVEDRPGESPAERLRRRADKLGRANHFEALGVHWSVSRAEIDRAFRHIEEECRPGSPASQIEPQAAAQILARARRAYQAVAREGDRRAYLLELLPDLDFEAIESVAEDQYHWHAWRGATEASQETSRLKQELLELARMQHQPPKS